MLLKSPTTLLPMAIPLNVHPHFNAEEAASVAAELVQSRY